MYAYLSLCVVYVSFFERFFSLSLALPAAFISVPLCVSVCIFFHFGSEPHPNILGVTSDKTLNIYTLSIWIRSRLLFLALQYLHSNKRINHQIADGDHCNPKMTIPARFHECAKRTKEFVVTNSHSLVIFRYVNSSARDVYLCVYIWNNRGEPVKITTPKKSIASKTHRFATKPNGIQNENDGKEIKSPNWNENVVANNTHTRQTWLLWLNDMSSTEPTRDRTHFNSDWNHDGNS